MKRSLLVLMAALLVMSAQFSSLVVAQDCAGSLAPQLAIGMRGEIAERFSTLRNVPAGQPLHIVYAPAEFTVLDGPVCAGYGPLTWYEIEYDDGLTGWASESQTASVWGANFYWLRPIDEQPTPEPTEDPMPEPTEDPMPEPTEDPMPEPTEDPIPDDPGNAGNYLPPASNDQYLQTDGRVVNDKVEIITDLFDHPLDFDALAGLNGFVACYYDKGAIASRLYTANDDPAVDFGVVAVANTTRVRDEFLPCAAEGVREFLPFAADEARLCPGAGTFSDGDNFAFTYLGRGDFCTIAEQHFSSLGATFIGQ